MTTFAYFFVTKGYHQYDAIPCQERLYYGPFSTESCSMGGIMSGAAGTGSSAHWFPVVSMHPSRKVAKVLRFLTRSRTSPLQKPPHQAFLNWVAFNRSFAPNIQDIERRTCPLVECEICFGSLEDMLGHVKECPRLSKGLYRCFETGREERIGRCESSRCLELQQCKDRIANSVNSLKRRLSPRGSGPRRQASIPLEMQSLSPEMNSGYDILCSVGLAELSGNTAVPPPAYTPTYYGSVQPPAELCSGYYSESVERSTIPSSGNYAELDAGDGSAQYSPVSLAQSQSEPAELGADVDLTYTTQRLGHYQYELSGLSTDNISYEAHHQVSALQQQPDRSLLSYLNSQETPNDWHQTFSTSDSPLPEDRYNFRPLHDEGFQNISSSTSNDLNDPIPLSSTHGYQAIYNVSLIGRGASTDSSVGNSIFSRSSNFPSRDASMSSVEPDQTPTDMSLTSDYIFLDESNRLCSEPDEIEPLSSPSTDIYDEFHHHSDSWDTQYDNGASPKDVGFVYPSHLTDMLPQEG